MPGAYLNPGRPAGRGGVTNRPTTPPIPTNPITMGTPPSIRGTYVPPTAAPLAGALAAREGAGKRITQAAPPLQAPGGQIPFPPNTDPTAPPLYDQTTYDPNGFPSWWASLWDTAPGQRGPAPVGSRPIGGLADIQGLRSLLAQLFLTGG